MEVYIEREQKTVEIEAATVSEALEKVGVAAETVLVVSSGKLLTLDSSLEDVEKLELLSVVSGG